MTDIITDLSISLADIDKRQKIDETREWRPILDGDYTDDQYVFVGFRAGDSPAVGDEIEYEGLDEVMWVYKTDYMVGELRDGIVTPQELIQDVAEEQPNIEIVGLCKYVRDLPPETS